MIIYVDSTHFARLLSFIKFQIKPNLISSPSAAGLARSLGPVATSNLLVFSRSSLGSVLFWLAFWLAFWIVFWVAFWVAFCWFSFACPTVAHSSDFHFCPLNDFARRICWVTLLATISPLPVRRLLTFGGV